MARESRKTPRRRATSSNPTNRDASQYDAAIPEAFARVGSTRRTIDGVTRAVPTIVLSGDWLKALGFPIDAAIYLLAEGHGRLAICRPGLQRPRWLRIVAR